MELFNDIKGDFAINDTMFIRILEKILVAQNVLKGLPRKTGSKETILWNDTIITAIPNLEKLMFLSKKNIKMIRKTKTQSDSRF